MSSNNINQSQQKSTPPLAENGSTLASPEVVSEDSTSVAKPLQPPLIQSTDSPEDTPGTQTNSPATAPGGVTDIGKGDFNVLDHADLQSNNAINQKAPERSNSIGNDLFGFLDFGASSAENTPQINNGPSSTNNNNSNSLMNPMGSTAANNMTPTNNLSSDVNTTSSESQVNGRISTKKFS